MEILALIIIVLLSFWLQSLIFEKYAFTKLYYTCEFSNETAVEGDNILFIEQVHNNKLLPLQWLKVEIYSSRWLDFAQTHSVVSQESRFVTSGYFLRSYQKTTRHWNVLCLKRGVYTVKSVSLVAGDLFGHSVKSIPVPINKTLIVFPKCVNLDALFIAPNHSTGDNIVKHWLIEDPFILSGIREYHLWDPMNKIHWPSVAKYGELMVRNNEYTNERHTDIILNIQSTPGEYKDVVNKGIIELGIKVTATLFKKAAETNMPVRFICNGSTVDNEEQLIWTNMSTGSMHTHLLFTLLAKLKLQKKIEFEDYIESNISRLDSKKIIIVTTYLTNRLCRILSVLKAKNTSIEILLLSNYTEPDIRLNGINVHFLTTNMENVLSKREMKTLFGAD